MHALKRPRLFWLMLALFALSPAGLTGCDGEDDVGDAIEDAADDVEDAADDAADEIEDAADDLND